jgi:hypothetical protein
LQDLARSSYRYRYRYHYRYRYRDLTLKEPKESVKMCFLEVLQKNPKSFFDFFSNF